MELNKNYSLQQIKTNGLEQKEVKELSSTIFTNNNKVYFFEKISEELFRLYTVIDKKSFFL